jgi:aminoglycoside phosphotransferase (APT) family kinase protein
MTRMDDALAAQFQDYYRRAFPQRAGACIIGAAQINNGWECDVYSFQVEWDADGSRQQERLVLRIYPGVDGYEKSAREYSTLQSLRRAGYPVPRADLLEQENSPFGKPFILMEFIAGRSMWGPMFNSPAEAEQRRLLALFCRLFARLHATDWRSFTPQLAEIDDRQPLDMVQVQLARWQPYVQAAPIPGFLAGWDWLQTHSRDVVSAAPAPIHWDFHPNNILLLEPASAAEEAVVIDWTGLEISDYRFDLAWTLLLVNLEGPEWRSRILAEYQRQSGQVVRDLAYFESAACFRRLYSVMVSVAYGAEKMGMRPGAEAQMRRQAPHLRRVYERSLAVNGITIPEVEAFLNSAGA